MSEIGRRVSDCLDTFEIEDMRETALVLHHYERAGGLTHEDRRAEAQQLAYSELAPQTGFRWANSANYRRARDAHRWLYYREADWYDRQIGESDSNDVAVSKDELVFAFETKELDQELISGNQHVAVVYAAAEVERQRQLLEQAEPLPALHIETWKAGQHFYTIALAIAERAVRSETDGTPYSARLAYDNGDKDTVLVSGYRQSMAVSAEHSRTQYTIIKFGEDYLVNARPEAEEAPSIANSNIFYPSSYEIIDNAATLAMHYKVFPVPDLQETT